VAAREGTGARAAPLNMGARPEPRRGTHAKARGLAAVLRRAALLLGQMGLAGPGGLAAGAGVRCERGYGRAVGSAR
jgi:hypothetical protein